MVDLTKLSFLVRVYLIRPNDKILLATYENVSDAWTSDMMSNFCALNYAVDEITETININVVDIRHRVHAVEDNIKKL